MTLTTEQQDLQEQILESIEGDKETYLETSHKIHAHPEVGNEEFFASGLLTALLENAGFKIDRQIPEHETAFFARKNSSKPGAKIGCLAEYDALPGLGHACGHNIIGTTYCSCHCFRGSD